jgi:hypothetical protein
MALTLVSCAGFNPLDPMNYMQPVREQPTYLLKRKQGLIQSPYAPRAGYVNIRGFQPGELVQCPYTGKVFRVPPQDQYIGIPVDN